MRKQRRRSASRGQRSEADQRLCFRDRDNIVLLISKSCYFLWLNSLISVGPVRKPHCCFFHDAVQLPWVNDPLAVADLVPLVLEIRSAVTVTGVGDFKMLMLMFSGTPGRKLLGVKTTYELKQNIKHKALYELIIQSGQPLTWVCY